MDVWYSNCQIVWAFLGPGSSNESTKTAATLLQWYVTEIDRSSLECNFPISKHKIIRAMWDKGCFSILAAQLLRTGKSPSPPSSPLGGSSLPRPQNRCNKLRAHGPIPYFQDRHCVAYQSHKTSINIPWNIQNAWRKKNPVVVSYIPTAQAAMSGAASTCAVTDSSMRTPSAFLRRIFFHRIYGRFMENVETKGKKFGENHGKMRKWSTAMVKGGRLIAMGHVIGGRPFYRWLSRLHIYIYIYVYILYILVGGFNPSEKSESQLGWWFPIYGKIKFMFQTTNQYIYIMFSFRYINIIT